MDITLYTNKVTTTSTNSTHRVQLDFDINWEYALALCPSDLIHAELSRRHKASKMSGVLIIEPIAGTPEIQWDFSIKREEDM